MVPRFGNNRVYVFDAFAYAYSIDAEGLVLVHRSDKGLIGSDFAVNDKVAVSALGYVSDLETGTYLRGVGSGSDGVPLFDESSGRFILTDNFSVSAWNPDSWTAFATLPVTLSNLSKSIRWGPDGLAMKGGSTVYFLTWPEGLAVNQSATRSVTAVHTGAAAVARRGSS